MYCRHADHLSSSRTHRLSANYFHSLACTITARRLLWNYAKDSEKHIVPIYSCQQIYTICHPPAATFLLYPSAGASARGRATHIFQAPGTFSAISTASTRCIRSAKTLYVISLHSLNLSSLLSRWMWNILRYNNRQQSLQRSSNGAAASSCQQDTKGGDTRDSWLASAYRTVVVRLL